MQARTDPARPDQADVHRGGAPGADRAGRDRDLAEAGYRGATFARIARQAGLSSTGLISYHFAGRDELIGEVVATVIGDIAAFMTQRMAGVTGPAAALSPTSRATPSSPRRTGPR